MEDLELNCVVYPPDALVVGCARTVWPDGTPPIPGVWAEVCHHVDGRLEAHGVKLSPDSVRKLHAWFGEWLEQHGGQERQTAQEDTP